MTQYTLYKFLMEFCGMERTTPIRVLEVNISEMTITFMVKIPNSTGEMIKKTSLKGLLISQTNSTGEAWGNFALSEDFSNKNVDLDNVDWQMIYEALTLKSVTINIKDYNILFPSLTS